MKDDYLDRFLDADELSNVESNKVAKNVLPNWISAGNSSGDAYKALLSLRDKKKGYIKKHGLKSQYTKKSNYLIQKSEVARVIGKNAQPLFNCNTYSEGLLTFFKELNKDLEIAKEKRIHKVKNGLQSISKESLMNKHKVLIKNHTDNQLLTVEEVLHILMHRDHLIPSKPIT